MKFKVGDKIVFHENYSKYGGPTYKHEGEIIGFSRGNDQAHGDYEIRFFHEWLKAWHRCSAFEKFITYSLLEKRNQKIDSILNI